MKYDKNAVEEFYNAFYLTIKAHVKYRFGYLADPEDMAQDIFMKLYTMETPSYVKAPAKWLGKFSDNFVIDQLRASRPELGLLESHPSDFDLEKTIVKFDLKNAMSHLDEISQKIIYLFELLGEIQLKGCRGHFEYELRQCTPNCMQGV